MPYIDYSNTGLFVNNTTNPDTKEKNAELKAMYNAFYNHNLSEKEISKLFHIDGYKSGIKILYAYHPFARLKEARTVYNKRIEDFLK